MKCFVVFSFLCLSIVSCEDCTPDDSAIMSRFKRQSNKYIYPMTGTWYKDTASGKYYFRQGNSIYVQRNDGYYSKWVTSGNGAEYVLNDKYKWTWDKQGRLYPLEDDCPAPIKENQKFGIPIKCLGGQCPDQAKFPCGGVWHYTNCRYYYDVGDTSYQLCTNGFYRKWSKRPPSDEAVQICPDNWTWDTQTGEWEPVPNSERRSCTHEDPPCKKKKNQRLTQDEATVPKSAFFL
ncbi:uncharacterized protein LOC123306331 [Coccinella septempunctata]|uniref:uncharacterized protein LOC123306331 n=1 Tax=Coccinella septempunctata TaxID=41139 RepID=UPI001D061842|nr:uncharacterized protein LOC123306331 [Coccinella septempunctata]